MAHLPIPPVRIPASKIAVPELPAEFTPRPLLLNLLDMATPGQVVVVSAPAGFGQDPAAGGLGAHDRRGAGDRLGRPGPGRQRTPPAVVGRRLRAAGPPRRPVRTSACKRVAGVAALQGGADLVEYLADALDTLESAGAPRPRRRARADRTGGAARPHPADPPQPGRPAAGHRQPGGSPDLDPPAPAGGTAARGPRRRPPLHRRRLRHPARGRRRRADPGAGGGPARTDRGLGRGAAARRARAAPQRRPGRVPHQLLRRRALGRRVPDRARSSTASARTPRTSCGRSACAPRCRPRSRPSCPAVPTRTGGSTSSARRPRSSSPRPGPTTASTRCSAPTSSPTSPATSPRRTGDLQAVAARWWSAREQPVHALRHAERAGDRGADRRPGAAVRRRPPAGRRPRSAAARPGGRGRRRAGGGPVARAHRRHHASRGAGAAGRRRRAGRTRAARGRTRRAPSSRPSARAPSSWPPARDSPAGRSRSRRRTTTASSRRWRRCCTGASGPPSSATRRRWTSASRGAISTRALELARENDLGYLEVQSLSMLATLAGVRGRPPGAWPRSPSRPWPRRPGMGRHPSAWTAGPAGMLAYADLLAGRPGRRPPRGRRRRWRPGSRCRPKSAYTLHAVHGAAVADLGQRPDGLAEMRDARSGLRGHPGAAVDARRADPARAPGRPVQRQPARGRGGGRLAGRPRPAGPARTSS